MKVYILEDEIVQQFRLESLIKQYLQQKNIRLMRSSPAVDQGIFWHRLKRVREIIFTF